MKDSDKTVDYSRVPKNILKKDDYLFFLGMVEDGLWQNSKYMSELCSVDEDTIRSWKLTEPAIQARKEASKDLLKDMKRRGTVDLKLKEAGVELKEEVEKHEVTVIIKDYGTNNNPSAKAEGSTK